MAKRLFLLMTVLGLLFTMGCEQLNLFSPQGTLVSTSNSEAATRAAATDDGILRLPTPTGMVIAQVAVEPAATSGPSSIAITGIVESTAGHAIVSWDAVGDFPSGFKVVWTEEQTRPTFPENTSTYASDPGARSAAIDGNPGTIYFVRVCRYINGGCDTYSELGIFAFAAPTLTPEVPSEATATVLAATKTKTVVPGTATPGIVITLMKDAGPGKAYIEWTAAGAFPNGFKIVYSKTNSTPVFGSDPYFYLSDGTARSAYVDGTPGKKYYYRICRYTGSTCDDYSATYTFTYPGEELTATPDTSTIAITGIADAGIGQASVTWASTGSFPNGYKILYSKTHNPPTLDDSKVYISDGGTHSGTITGNPSGTYHVRVCKYSGSGCTLYSAVTDFTFAADTSTITITGITDTATGHANLNWDASGAFTKGFKILYSTTEVMPTYENAEKFLVESGTAHTTPITGLAGTLYYYRVCKYTGGGCSVYSNVYPFTYAATP